MALESNLECRSYPAAGDLSADQYKFVLLNTAGRVAVNTALGGRCTGVLVHPAAAIDRAVTVAVEGRCKAIAGGVLAIGDPVMSDAAGKAVLATGALYTLGYAVDAGNTN